MRPFPDAKGNPLEPSAELQQAFDAALERAAPRPTAAPLAIVAIDPTGPPHAFAGQLVREVHFSASLLKVAAMYAAFELRRAAHETLAELQPPPDEVFATLEREFDDTIRSERVPQLDALPERFLLPRYRELFELDAATGTINFSRAFFGDLFDGIADGKNPAAGRCIQRIGFGYLTKAVATAGFFNPGVVGDPRTADGIWLCGDFQQGFPAQRIPSVNDGLVAQATSARHLVRLFALLLDRKLVGDGVSDDAMLNLLQQAIVPPRVHLFLNRDVDVQYVTLHTKIGSGDLKAGGKVASEAAIVRELSTDRFFVVVFQNQRFTNDASIKPISQLVDATIAAFLFP
jgi:hypothetical protein